MKVNWLEIDNFRSGLSVTVAREALTAVVTRKYRNPTTTSMRRITRLMDQNQWHTLAWFGSPTHFPVSTSITVFPGIRK